MSYNHLPAYLKPCFLYVGVFPEGCAFSVSELIQLWVSEGFLKPLNNNKSLEIAAEVYLKELVDRNLILVYELGSLGSVKLCRVHGLVRDLSYKEAQKQGFYHLSRQHSPRGGMNNHRRIVIHGSRGGPEEKVELDAAMLESMPLARSYLSVDDKFSRLPALRLLRTLSPSVGDGCQEYFLEDVFRFVNLRYLLIGALDEFQIPSSVHLLWGLHTLIVCAANDLIAPIEIWKMQQLRHVEFTSGSLIFPDPPEGDRIVLENLQMAGCLSHLHRMIELERFYCRLRDPSVDYLHEVYFPHSLKRFRLICSSACVLDLEHMLQKMASLPLLEKLMVSGDFSFPANKREITIEGRFQCLKILTLHLLPGLEKWRMPDDSSHFPLLKKLRLYSLRKLEAIPLEIGDIATLECISLVDCSETAVLSAKKIMEEQEDLHGDQLQLSVEVVYTKNYAERECDMQALQYFASPNFSILKYDHN